MRSLVSRVMRRVRRWRNGPTSGPPTNWLIDREELLRRDGHLDLTARELRTIAAYVCTNERRKPSPTYLEVGVCGGGTMLNLKRVTKRTNFLGVDLFEDFQCNSENTHVSGTFRMQDVKELLGDRTELIKGDSTVVLPTLNRTFDFIFIDGNHKYAATRKDFENAVPLLAEDGQIAFHNCSSHADPDHSYILDDGGPWQVTQELLHSPDWIRVADEDRLQVFMRRRSPATPEPPR